MKTRKDYEGKPPSTHTNRARLQKNPLSKKSPTDSIYIYTYVNIYI